MPFEQGEAIPFVRADRPPAVLAGALGAARLGGRTMHSCRFRCTHIALGGLAPMSERDLIEEAFGSTIKSIYNVFFQSYTEAKGSPISEKKAEDAFRNGVKHARQVRDRAIALVP
jgi:hypothetical protein